MIKIIFICHGNICRSPMAEFVMKDMVKKAGVSDEFLIESAATSREELGNPVYPPVRKLARRAWYFVRRARCTANDGGGLRQIRPPHRHGFRKSHKYDADLRRRSGK